MSRADVYAGRTSDDSMEIDKVSPPIPLPMPQDIVKKQPRIDPNSFPKQSPSDQSFSGIDSMENQVVEKLQKVKEDLQIERRRVQILNDLLIVKEGRKRRNVLILIHLMKMI